MKKIKLVLLVACAALSSSAVAQYRNPYAAPAPNPYAAPSYSAPRTTMPSYGTGSNYSSTQSSGYTTNSGTYVAPYQRSTPDYTPNNNYSTKGNTNPYTGTAGTQRGRPW